MSRIRAKDTGPELLVRSALHRMGFRFRLHHAGLPGRPDIVLKRHMTAVFVHGCFWHRHPKCRFAYTPKTRVAFWSAKFAANTLRDKKVRRALQAIGWRTIVIWECESSDPTHLKELIRARMNFTRNGFPGAP